MANPEMKQYLDATTAHRLKHGVDQARERHADFLALFEKYKAYLLSCNISSETMQQNIGSTRLRVKTQLGDIYADAAFTFDDGYVGAAILFTDEKIVDDRTVSRKLNAVVLSQDGKWIDSDGDSVASPYGDINQHSAYTAVHKALAAKLKADTEYILSFKRSQ